MRSLSLLLMCVAAVSFLWPASADRLGADVLDRALLAASSGDHVRLVGLLRGGLSPDTEVVGLPLLAHAAAGGHVEATRALLRQGADVDRRSSDGRTPLMLAAGVDGSAATIRVLLEAGADENAENPDGYSVLMFAVSSREPEHVRLLLGAGADVTHRSRTGSDAFAWAVDQPHILRMLESRRP